MPKYLFGGDKPWDASQFTAADDSIRGGKSYSYFGASENGGQVGAFNGNLDSKALGGAGFASQRTVDDFPGWDLSAYDALVVNVYTGHRQMYTIVLKDEVLPKRPDGREQSTVSWEYNFFGAPETGTLVVPFTEFKATYRGKLKPDAKPLDLKNVRRFSFMCRSFFGEQDGIFYVLFRSISVREKDASSLHRSDSNTTDASFGKEKIEAKVDQIAAGRPSSWLGWLCGGKI